MRIVKEKHKDSRVVYQAKTIKDKGGSVLFENDKVKERWRSYFCYVMIVKNKRVDREVEPEEEYEEENDVETQVTQGEG